MVKGTPDQIPQLLPYTPEKAPRFDSDFDEEEEKEPSEDVNLQDDEDSEDGISERIKRAKELQRQQRMMEMEEEERTSVNRKKSYQSSEPPMPKVIDPYASDETSFIIPILVAVGAFIPLLFCLCKL